MTPFLWRHLREQGRTFNIVLFQLYSGDSNWDQIKSSLFRCVSFHFHECLSISYFFDWLSDVSVDASVFSESNGLSDDVIYNLDLWSSIKLLLPTYLGTSKQREETFLVVLTISLAIIFVIRWKCTVKWNVHDVMPFLKEDQNQFWCRETKKAIAQSRNCQGC